MTAPHHDLFDPAQPWDAGCEREHRAFGVFMAKRFRKAAGRSVHALSQEDAAHAVIVGALMAVLTTARAVQDGDGFSAAQRAAWHDLVDFGFTFVEGIVPRGEESVQ